MDWKNYLPAIITGAVGLFTILINYIISKRQIDNANRLAEQQRSIIISTTIEKEWRANVRLYTAAVLNNGTQFCADRFVEEKTKQTIVGKEKHLNELVSNISNLNLLLDYSIVDNAIFLTELQNFVGLLDKIDIENAPVLLGETRAKISSLIHKVVMIKGS